MSDPSKTRKLGRGLAGLMGTPVAVPLPPQTDAAVAAPNKSIQQNATEQKPAYVSPPSSVSPAARTLSSAGVSGGGGGAAPIAPAASRPAAPATQSAAAPAPTPYVVVRVDEVVPNRFQPRRDFEPAALGALAASIKRDGVMQPLVVRKVGASATGGTPVPSKAKWELVAGERRWRAAQAAGLTHVPAVVVDIPDITAAMWAVVENVQRVDLGTMEKSHAYARLSKEFGLTQSEISEQVGEDRTLVSHYIRIGELEPAVIELIQAGKITFGHSKVLNSPLVKPGEVRVALAQRAANEALSVRQLELLIQRGGGRSIEEARTVTWTPSSVALADAHADLQVAVKDAQKRLGIDPDAAKAKAFEARANVRDLEEQIGKHLGTKVKIKTAGNGKRGTLSIEFFNLDHFDGLLSKIGVKHQS